MKRIHKRIFSILIMIAMLMSLAGTAVLAADYEYNVGPIAYEMERKYICGTSDAAINGSSIIFSEGGSVEYDFYLPFNAVSVDITYTAEKDGTFTVTTDEGKTAQASLTAGYKVTSTANFEITERKGERKMTFSTDIACTVSKITFNKEKIKLVQDKLYLCDLTDNEVAIQTAVLLDIKSSILMVNGSRRYINNDNPKEICENFNGHVYLPAHTLARAFGMYIEDMPHRDYLLIRNEKMEFAFCEDVSYKEVFGKEKQNIKNVVKYKNGKAYLPLRYFAEEIGKTVGYKDGIVAIDDKFSVADILDNDTVFSYVKEEFSKFYPTEDEGKTYYVSQNEGSDSFIGSSDKPFKTLKKAICEVSAGDTVIVREGEYREILELFDQEGNPISGLPTSPITFKADGDNVYLSAAEVVSGFTEYKKTDNGKTIYKANLPESWQDLGDGRNQVFFNKNSMVEARYPNGPSIDMGEGNEPLPLLWPVLGDLKSVSSQQYDENGNPLTDDDGDYVWKYNERVESDTLLNQETGYWNGATYVAMRGNGFALSTAKVKQSGKGYLILGDFPLSWDKGKPIYQNYGYLSGHMNALDTNEEWFIEDGILYFIPPEGTTIEELNSCVEVKARHIVADISQSSFVRLDGFNTIGGSIRMNDSEMCTLTNMNMKYINHFVYSKDQASGFIETADRTNPEGEPAQGEVGIYIGGTDNIVINNNIDTAAGAAIYGVGCYTYIENNTIANCGYAGSYVAGLFFTQEEWESHTKKQGGNFIYQNTVYNAGRATMLHIQASGMSGLRPYLPEEIAFNDFHDGMLTTQDTGITYEYWISMGHEKLFTKMHHNLVYMKTARENPYSFGIYHDGGTMNIDTYANVVFATAPNSGFTHDMVYNQTYTPAYAHCPEWNNIRINESVVGGRDALTPSDFPNQKPFYAGSYLDEEYLVNYNNISGKSPYTVDGVYYAKDAEISEGAAIENNAVALDAGEYIKFNGESLDIESNEINLEFYGDEFNTGDTIEVIIGDTIDTGTVYAGTLKATSHDRDDINIFTIRTEIFKGKNVFVRMKKPKSAKIYKLRLGKDHIEQSRLSSDMIYGGSFTTYTGSSDVLQKKEMYNGEIIPVAYNTLTNSTLIYKNVAFGDKVSKIKVYYAGNSDRQIEIRIDSKTGPIIGTLDVSGTNKYTECLLSEAELTTPIEAGTHTVYVKFKGEGYTTDLYWLSFE